MKHIKTYKVFENTSNWKEVDNQLQRELEFTDFSEALDFINKIGIICQVMNHHPNIEWVYNKVKLSLSTHDAGDIVTEKDIKLASKIDEILTQFS